MTDREKAIVMAYTGYAMLTGDKLGLYYQYIQEIVGRPVMTHELAEKPMQETIHTLSKPDFVELCRTNNEPRVMTLEEVRERKAFILWTEDTETGAQVFPVTYVGGLYVDSAEDWSVDPDHRNTPEYYGKSWRFWDKKPTNEQRQAVKWDEAY